MGMQNMLTLNTKQDKAARILMQAGTEGSTSTGVLQNTDCRNHHQV